MLTHLRVSMALQPPTISCSGMLSFLAQRTHLGMEVGMSACLRLPYLASGCGLTSLHEPPGTFRLTLEFQEEYPNKAPVVKFKSTMFHPNSTFDMKCLSASLTVSCCYIQHAHTFVSEHLAGSLFHALRYSRNVLADSSSTNSIFVQDLPHAIMADSV